LLGFAIDLLAPCISDYRQGKKKAITPAVTAPNAPPPIQRPNLQFGFGGIRLNTKPTINDIMKNATATAKCKGSHLFKKLPSKGAQKPPMNKGSHRHIESLVLLVCSVIRFTKWKQSN
jgi:hypothetical protein